MESAARGGADVNGEDIYKMGAYLFKTLKDKQVIKEEISITCYNCQTKTSAPVKRHKVNCPARSVKCYNCQHVGHFSIFCKSSKNIKVEEKMKTDEDLKDNHEKVYNVNLFRINYLKCF